MKRLNALLLLLLLTASVWGESAFSQGLKFDLPKGFRPMTAEEIKLKFPGGNPPQVAYTNSSLSCTVAMTHSTSKLEPDQIAEFRAAMEGALKQRPDLEWETSEVLTIGGRKWMHFVFLSQATDQKIRNEMLGTSMQGRALLINLNCTVKDYPKYKQALSKLRDSLELGS